MNISIVQDICNYALSIFLGLATAMLVSKYLDSKLRKAMAHINTYNFPESELAMVSKGGRKLSIIHKNKRFEIYVAKVNVNKRYHTYRVFINDQLAGVYHVLHKFAGCSYYFEGANNRLETEVISIIFAGNKALKKLVKDSKTKKPEGYVEYSYFK